MAHLGTLTNRSGHCDDSKQVNENSLQDARPDPALAGDRLLGSFLCHLLVCPGVPGSKGPFLICGFLGVLHLVTAFSG